jgi:hypothetical protein
VVCRIWRGWTTRGNAQSYDDYLQKELFPGLERKVGKSGYRGYQLLRLEREEEVEFMTMLWFDSLDHVRSFAGEHYEVPVISDKARSLLSRYANRADHFELRGSRQLEGSGMEIVP